MKKTIIAAILGTTVALASASAMAVSSSDSLTITLPVIDTNHTLNDQAGGTKNNSWKYTTTEDGTNKLEVTFNTYSAGSDKSYNFTMSSDNGGIVPINFHPHGTQIEIKTGDNSQCTANLIAYYPAPLQPGSYDINVGSLKCQ